MENVYTKFSLLAKKLLVPVFFLFTLLAMGQTSTNLNNNGISQRGEVGVNEKDNIPFFAQAKRARTFSLNPNIAKYQGLHIGQKIRLELFNDKDFKSTIISKTTDVNGVTSVTVKIDDFKYAFGYIVVSEDSYLITIDIPELKEKYTTRKNKETDTDFIFLLDESKMEKFEECDPKLPEEGNERNQKYPHPSLQKDNFYQNPDGEINNSGISENSTANDPAAIDIMIVYTPAAREWSDTYDGGINNTIATAMATANTVSSNSQLGINFNLVYSGLVDYTEQNNGADLSALYNDGDGLLDEVHNIRKEVSADMVAFFTYSGGGVAFLLNSKYGSPESAFSLTGIQSAKSFTFPHELGHNMGLGHYKYQNVQPGNNIWSNWPENTWSGGWRWRSTDSNMYSDVMTYESGHYHDDGITSYRTPYFSDPNHIYIGARAGDEVEGNGSRTLKDMKHVIADYSNAIAYCSASSSTLSTLYINNITMGEISNDSFQSGDADYSSIAIPILPQETQSLQIGVSGFGSKKEVLVWIDWNDDAIFDPVTELEYTSTGNHDLYTAEITAPLGVEAGNRRMRIRLHDLDSGGNSTPCGNTEQGEVEEYTIALQVSPACEIAMIPQSLVDSKIESDHYRLSWEKIEGVSSYELRYRKAGAEAWNNVSDIVYPFYKLEDLEESTSYEAQVRSICSDTPSEYSSAKITTTDAAATSIAFEGQPQETQEGRTLSTSVELLDELGNRKNSTAEITVSLIDDGSNGATLSGTLTVAAIDGLATFKDLRIDEAGTYKLEATHGSLNSVSSSFEILPYEQTNYVVTNAENKGPGSLREAIELANQSESQDLITFNISGQGPHKIELFENLPAITQKIELDATVQPNYNSSSPQIIIDGSKVPRTTGSIQFDLVPKAFYLIGNSSGSVIRGFILGGFGEKVELENGDIQNYFGAAIITQGTGAHRIQSNFIGISANGTEAFGNFGGIYVLGGTDNLIGGSSPGERNVISGNSQFGVATSSTSNNNKILGNFIGISSDGTSGIPNGSGLIVYAQSFENLIEGNTISGNNIGIYFTGRSNLVFNNYIGTDPNGNFAIPNHYGMAVLSDDNTIGAKSKGNLISGNSITGIYFENASNNRIIANLIGLDKSKSTAIPNDTGIYFHNENNSGNMIGDANEDEGNIISGNLSHGIHITYSPDNKVFGNFIGALKDGSQLGNGGDGIRLSGSHNTTVGGGDGKTNLIAYNGGAAVAITEYGSNNSISQNKIFSNFSMGIDLGADGTTQNDRDDRDHGPNNFQNSPELKNSAALEQGLVNLEYLIGSTSQYAAFPIKVEFYKSDGNGQGKEYLGTDNYLESDISKGKKGKFIGLELVPGSTLNGGDKIVATATDANGNTSEFGNSIDVTGGCAETIYYADSDGDGLGDLNDFQSSCTQPEGYVINSDDCDDTDPDTGTGQNWFADIDEDGYGDPDDTKGACDQPEGYIDNSEDCNDSDALINPNTIWYADGDGDELGDLNNFQTACNQPDGFVRNSDDCDDTDAEIRAGITWYADYDGDGFGDPETTRTSCEQPEGYVRNNEDCDDSNAESSTGSTWYADTDSDGYGDPNNTEIACLRPDGYVANSEDCDDAAASVNPDTIWYEDSDGDGFGDPDSSSPGCEQPADYVANNYDCNDADAQTNPDTTWYSDSDGDGFGDPGVTTTACEQPTGYVANNEDCDDTDSAVNPASTDVCNDCDNTNDAGCEVECLGTDILYLSEVCTNGSTVNWVINNPDTCTVEVRWELRKKEDSGVLTVPPGETYFTSGTASKGSTQVTMYWSDSNGSETKTNTNASGISCTSSSGFAGDEFMGDPDPALKIYPNPVTSEGIWLHFAEREESSQFKVVAYDLSGRKMAETVVSVPAAGNDILWEVDHSRWIEGIYVLNASSGKEVYQIKIIK